MAAADPATHPDALGRIASQRPDLRPLIAANPAAPQGLRDWLRQQGVQAPIVVPPRRSRGGLVAVVVVVSVLLVGLVAVVGLFAVRWMLGVTSSAPDTSAITETMPVSPTPDEPARDYGSPDTWQLSLEGFGPLRLGMTAYEGVETGGFKLIDYCSVGALEWTGRYDAAGDAIVLANLDTMGRVWRINIYGSPSPLDTGIGMGDPEERLFEEYGNRLVGDSRNGAPGKSYLYAVNGENTHLHFVASNGVLSTQSGISLMAGNVTPNTITNASTCKEAYRK
jgi:hypothetical protein